MGILALGIVGVSTYEIEYSVCVDDWIANFTFISIYEIKSKQNITNRTDRPNWNWLTSLASSSSVVSLGSFIHQLIYSQHDVWPVTGSLNRKVRTGTPIK